MQDRTPLPWPPPLRARPIPAGWRLSAEVRLASGGLAPRERRALLPTLERLRRALAGRGCTLRHLDADAAEVRLERRPGGTPESYSLAVGPGGATLAGADLAGLRHGLRTLAQLVEDAHPSPATSPSSAAARGEVAGLEVEDAPAFAERGAMLDVSRDRVPRMDTLFALVERFADWKLNRLQLYTEHTFAYRDHELVWRDASPLTHDEVRALDAHCAARGIELVPNQQSFGHLHRWLVHAPYRDLAECPEGVEHPFSFEREPFSLCPTDPRSLELLAGLYDELLPCFASRSLNVGLDETFDLGLGRSRAACEEAGASRVYLQFLRTVGDLVRARGHRMQFWADIVLRDEELVGELPRDAVPLLWGYEADHPFEDEARRVGATGLEFHVCPGTSSWQSLAGRTGNMIGNVLSAATHGLSNGARGLLVTDWGDRGHLQPLVASLPGWLLGAAAAWNPEGARAASEPAPLADALDRRALMDPTGRAGRALLELGRVAEVTGARSPNASPFSLALTSLPGPFPTAEPTPSPEGLTREGWERGCAQVESAAALGGAEGLSGPEGGLLARELELAVTALRTAGEVGRARLEVGAAPLSSLPAARRRALREGLEELLARHRASWLERSRPGGLESSCRWLERVSAALDGERSV